MSNFAIPNPKKTITVDFPLDKIKESARNISLLHPKYRFYNSNEVFNQYTYEATEFLSWGVYMYINLNSISSNKTEITIEIVRKIGAFDYASEAADANMHIDWLIHYLSQLAVMSSAQITDIKNQQIQQADDKKREKEAKKQKRKFDKENFANIPKTKKLASTFAFLFGFIGIHRLYLGQKKRAYLCAAFFWTLIPAVIGIIDGFIFLFMSQEKFDLKYNQKK